MKSIDLEQRATLSRLIRDERKKRRWSVEDLAQTALARLHAAMRQDPNLSGSERVAWESLSISRHHIATLENCPARPLNDPERRGRLLGVVLALGLDRARINRLAGGI